DRLKNRPKATIDVMANGSDRLPETRGRPRLLDDDAILDAALSSFSNHGFDAMSLRSLNRDLGVSYGTVNQRFGSKEKLFYAAVDHGFTQLYAAAASLAADEPTPANDLEYLRLNVRAFLEASIARPELLRLMNREGLEDTDRLDHIWTHHIEGRVRALHLLLRSLAETGLIRPVSIRSFFFALTHGATAPHTLTALSGRFDQLDGPLDPTEHARLTADLLVNGLVDDTRP
ncbi:MAG: TetR/AcrR family transcriptional regulator, partial [Actinomycetota bacterium]